MKRGPQKHKAPFVPANREHRMILTLSDAEQHIVDGYLQKYKIKNKSRWLRETVLQFIHKNMEDDYPTLFGEHDMRR
jgi:hypothetical protein